MVEASSVDITPCTSRSLELTVDIYENERRWVGKGFGKGGLLPTDPNPFSTTDRSFSWKTKEEASNDPRLLGRGWAYKNESVFSVAPRDDLQMTREGESFADPEKCWMYAKDFKSLNEATPEQGSLQFVRFRRLRRTKLFRPEEFIPKELYEKCDHCDSMVVESISSLLWDILSYCSLLHNMTRAKDSDIIPLKDRLLNLAFSHQLSNNTVSELDGLPKKLTDFVGLELSNTKMSRLLSSINFSFLKCKDRIEHVQRRAEIGMRHFPKEERDIFAALIVRNVDPHFQKHCDEVGCGEGCRFARVQCSNEGCVAIMSRVHIDSHDETCICKVMTCACGDMFPKHELPKHLSEVCKLREVPCVFANIGCLQVTKACDMNQHIVDDIGSHLLLAVNRMMEYEEQMRKMCGKIKALEHENIELRHSLAQQEVLTKTYEDVGAKVDKTWKALTALEVSSKIDFKKVREDIEKREKASANVIKTVNAKVNEASKKLATLELSQKG